MSTKATAGQRPFGLEYLEPVAAATRGSQVTGPADGCCVTYNSSILTLGDETELDLLEGGAFCDDIDMCVAN